MLGTILTTAAATVLAASAAGLLGYRQYKRTKFAKQLRITAPNGIDESGPVRIGGIDQYLSIRGDDLRNPVILEILGGPGASNMAFLPRTRGWEKHFTIVRWDMRGAGFTYAADPGGQGEMSLDRLYLDALEVTEYVRRRMNVAKVLLVANSFGTVTGLRLARNHPELYSAYVGTDQNIIAGGRENSAYDELLVRLAKKDKKTHAKAAAFGRDRGKWTVEQWSLFNKLALTTDALSFDTMKTVVIRSLWFSPMHNLRGLRSYLKAMTFSERIAPSSSTVDEWAEGTTFRLPVFVFQGANDVLTPPEPARRFVNDIDAPVKDFALIHDASHFAAFRHRDQFLRLMLGKVRPVVTGDRITTANDVYVA